MSTAVSELALQLLSPINIEMGKKRSENIESIEGANKVRVVEQESRIPKLVRLFFFFRKSKF